jgi:hypothetical protein
MAWRVAAETTARVRKRGYAGELIDAIRRPVTR